MKLMQLNQVLEKDLQEGVEYLVFWPLVSIGEEALHPYEVFILGWFLIQCELRVDGSLGFEEPSIIGDHSADHCDDDCTFAPMPTGIYSVPDGDDSFLALLRTPKIDFSCDRPGELLPVKKED